MEVERKLLLKILVNNEKLKFRSEVSNENKREA